MNRGGILRRLLLSHIGVALSSLLTIMLLVNAVVTISFRFYIEDQREADAEYWAAQLATYYDNSNKWTTADLMDISHQAMMQHYHVRIYDTKQTLLWDTRTMNMPIEPEDSLTGNSQPIGGDSAISKEISKEGRVFGILQLTNMDNFYQQQDQRFLQMFNRLSWAALAVVLLGVYFFSRYVAKGISNPLIQIKQIAVRMRKGDLTQRVKSSGVRTEIEEVGLALNHLADGLVQQDKLRKNLTADIAHEWRTPLATIQSHIEAFQDGVWDVTPEKLEICHQQVIRLVQLIHDLEKLTDAENPMIQLKKDNICLNRILRDSINATVGQFPDSTISLRFHEDHEVYMIGDADRLVQVFVNLLNNAYKYTAEGCIDIVLAENQTQITVSIKDTGVGIEPGELPYIFERFYRGDKSRNRKTGGAGIGLAVVKAIVETHGGSVTVNSRPWQGTEFAVRFPK